MKKIKTFEEKCYEMYKLHWMLTHGWTLTDLYDIFVGLAVREIEDEPMHIPTDGSSMTNMAEMLKEMFLTEDGFGNGSLYVCFDEFIEHEFQDRAYMEELFRLEPGTFEENTKRWEEAIGRYHAELVVRPNTAAYIRKIMAEEPKSESDCFGEDDTITLTAEFSNGYEADIKVCGVQYEEGGNNTAWAEAVLYYKGREEFVSEPVDGDIFGSWELYDHGGEKYIVDVIEASAENLQNKEEKLEVETTAGTVRAYKSQCPGEPGITVMFQPKGQDDEIDVVDIKAIEDRDCQTNDKEDPEDLVVLTYGSPYTEDYTKKNILKRRDVCEALGIEKK